jgi:hypothetical protein
LSHETINFPSVFYATSEYDLSFNKKDALSRKKDDKNEFDWPGSQSGHPPPGLFTACPNRVRVEGGTMEKGKNEIGGGSYLDPV